MPTCGGFSIGVKLSIPKFPRFVTVNVPPPSSSGEMYPSKQAAANRFASWEIAFNVNVSASRMTGTMRQRGVSTANPRFTCRYREMVFSTSRAFQIGMVGQSARYGEKDEVVDGHILKIELFGATLQTLAVRGSRRGASAEALSVSCAVV